MRSPRRVSAVIVVWLVGVLGAALLAPVARADSIPGNASPPSITGVAGQAETLTASGGSWAGTVPIVYGYAWERCDSSGGGCSAVAGADGQTYGLALADVGHAIRVVVTATNSAGSAQATSDATGIVGALSAPVSTVVPQLSGTERLGQTLTASSGTWRGTPAPTYTYQWRRCDSTGMGCVNIPGATTLGYVLVAADVGGRVEVVVTALNSAGTSSQASSLTVVVAGTPVSTVAPTVSGTPLVGQTLAASVGSWGGAPPPTFVYQWKRCDPVGNGCAAITGATSDSYLASVADSSHRLVVTVTATNVVGSASATSAPTGAVAPLIAPVNASHPTISGVRIVGQSLTANPENWRGTPPLVFSYLWQRCNYDGTACLTIPGATSQSYTLVTADFNHRVQVVVTASNSVGRSSTSSGQTSTIQSGPIVTQQPALFGTARVGHIVYVGTGVWLGSDPVTFTDQWQRCDTTGNSCQDIPGATNSAYQPVPADVGMTVRGVITARNPLGTVSEPTPASASVLANPEAPRWTDSPAIVGRAIVGDVLHAEGKPTIGVPAPTLAYQWQRCSGASDQCADIPAAHGPAYRIRTGDTSSPLRVAVTATNTVGSSTNTSSSTEPAISTAMTRVNIGQSVQQLKPNGAFVRLALLEIGDRHSVSIWLELDSQRTNGWSRLAILRVTHGPRSGTKILSFDVGSITIAARISIRWRSRTGHINQRAYLADTTALRPETPVTPRSS